MCPIKNILRFEPCPIVLYELVCEIKIVEVLSIGAGLHEEGEVFVEYVDDRACSINGRSSGMDDKVEGIGTVGIPQHVLDLGIYQLSGRNGFLEGVVATLVDGFDKTFSAVDLANDGNDISPARYRGHCVPEDSFGIESRIFTKMPQLDAS